MGFNSQICTTREQSERLLALGLKKGTADMAYEYKPKHLADTDPDKDWILVVNGPCGTDIPAWSLHRLIEMADTYIEFSPFTGVTFQDGSFSTNRDNDYDAIVDIIEWLIQKEHFNKEYLEE